ncbi:uncharacterized protein LOC133451273 isoform X1 [Cololabis saira]|uniref:uncharacterized protein LOC133451273 isoform X1 n=1 Tax=Cololabis saira TaxID=129043 RepID=UPI002AD58B5F|nr:uncharacterized protein LOC133451273 isoform X1 [Cololabis saira]
MDGLHIVLLVILGAFSCSPWISGSVLEVTARPGDNITVYCDCKPRVGEYIVWFRNCSHENQPSLVLTVFSRGDWDNRQKPSRFEFVRNLSNNSYDLLITNISGSDEGLYYCGTKEEKVEVKEKVVSKTIYKYGNITSIKVGKDIPEKSSILLVPVVSAISGLGLFSLLYITFIHFCQKADQEPQIYLNHLNTRGQTKSNLDEDMFLTKVVFQAQKKQAHHQLEDDSFSQEKKV